MTNIIRALEKNILFEFCTTYCYFNIPLYYKRVPISTLAFRIENSETYEYQKISYSILQNPHAYAALDKTGNEHKEYTRTLPCLR